MSKLMVKDGDIWVPMEGLKGDTGPLPAAESIPDTALVTDGAKTNTAYLMHNRLTKDAEGELISVEDAYAVPPVSFGAEGVSTQVTTTGKNLLSDVESDYHTGTVDGAACQYLIIPIETYTTYYFHSESTGGIAFYIGFTHSTEEPLTTTWHNTGTNLTNFSYSNTNHNWMIVYFSTTYTVSQFISNLRSMRKQLEHSTTFTGYESYTGGKPSPSPEYPQEIESIDLLESTIVGKNLALFNDSVETKTANGLTFTKNGQNLKVSGTTTTWNIDSMSMTYVSKPFLKAGNKYILSLQGAYSGVASSTFYFRTRNLGETNTTLHYPSVKNQQCAFTPTKDCIITSFVLRIGKTDGDVNVDAYPQLELGSTATEYQPYSGVTAALDFSEEPLRSLPDGTKDELHLTYIRPSTREGWAYYRGEKVKRVDIAILDGSESYGSEGGRFYVRQNNMKRLDDYSQSLMCNFLKAYPKQTYIGGVVNFVSGISGYYHATSYAGQNWFYVAIKKGMTADDTKQWVSEHPITIHYPLATPETIDLGIFELPAMQSGTTNLWSDPSTNLSVTYERDRNIVITNLKAAVADLATS